MALTQSYPSMFWQQFHDENGNPLANGTVKTFLASDHSMPVQTYTYPGSGVKNPTNITLDDAGKCIMALEIGLAYYIEVYDSGNNLKGTFDNVTAGGDGTGGEALTFSSSDGSISITRTGNNVDLKVVKDTELFGTVEGFGVNSSGVITFTRIVEGGITLDSGNIVVEPFKLYHLTVHLELTNSTPGVNYTYAKLIDSENHVHKFITDASRYKQNIEISFDIIPTREYISLSLENLGATLSDALVYIHRVNPVVGGGSGGGTGSNVSITSDDRSVEITQRVVEDTVIYDLSVDTFSGDYNDLSNKPDLSVYARSADLAAVATSGSYNDLNNKPVIPAAQVNSDWNASSGVAEILNKPSIPSKTSDLTNDSGFITSSDVPGAQEQADWNEADSNDPAYIKNKPSIPAAQVNSDWNASSGVAEILNKPSIPSKTSDLQNDSGYITTSGVPGAQEQSDWNEGNSSDPAYIKNKPSQVGLVPGTNINLVEDNVNHTLTINATAATQQQADWNQSNSSAVDYIKNKPTIPAAQVNSDWEASNGAAKILNKPFFKAEVPTYTVTAADISNGYCIIPIRMWDVSEMPHVDELYWFISFDDMSWLTNYGSNSMDAIVDKIKFGFCDDQDDWEGIYEPNSGPAPLGEVDGVDLDRVPGYPTLVKPINLVSGWYHGGGGRSIQGPSIKIVFKTGTTLAADDRFQFGGCFRVIKFDY